jgi:hypothetical protein
MTNYKTKSVLIYDHGTFVSVAERLAKDFGKVYYYSPWKSSFPQKKFTLIGDGIKGVERVNNYFDYINDVDLFVFPDLIDGDLQLHLESLGCKVWGSRKGEELELERVAMKKLIVKLGLPLGHYEVVKGVENLRTYLKEHKNIWIKVDCFRGDFETVKSINYEYISPKIDEIEANLGAFKNHVEFICEDDLPNRVELAYDGYTVDGQYPTKTLCGIEIKDLGYIGVCKDYKNLPDPVKEFNTKISPILKKYNYRNFFHPEMRIGKDKLGYVIDPAARFGSPPNEVYQELFTNLSDIIWNGAHGVCIDPIPQGKYAVEVLVHCNWAERNWLPVQFPSKYKDNIKFRNVTVIDNQYYIVPQYLGLPEIGAIVTMDDTIQGAMDKVNEIADEMKGYYIDIPCQSLDKATEEIEKLKSFGYNLFE